MPIDRPTQQLYFQGSPRTAAILSRIKVCLATRRGGDPAPSTRQALKPFGVRHAGVVRFHWAIASSVAMTKAFHGNFFEDFGVGRQFVHATPRTLTWADAALYVALYGARFAVQSADTFAQSIGYPRSPLDDLLVFHVVFGKTVPDISLNAVANLGYAGVRFLAPVYSGDTLSARSEIIGLKESSNQHSGIVYVRSQGFNQHGETVLDYIRWVIVRKRDPAGPAPPELVPALPACVEPDELGLGCPPIAVERFDPVLSGSPHRWGDYAIGEKLDHVDGTTIEEAEHQIATRLYQNAAKVHFNQFSESKSTFGRRLVYGGHAISVARALSFNGLANAFHISAINGGQHVAPLFAGSTVFAWSKVLDKATLPHRQDVGALRLRTIATIDRPCADFPDKHGESHDSAVILDLDYWALLPR